MKDRNYGQRALQVFYEWLRVLANGGNENPYGASQPSVGLYHDIDFDRGSKRLGNESSLAKDVLNTTPRHHRPGREFKPKGE